MLDTSAFGDKLKSLGYNLFTGVPCSFLKNLINYAINESNYIPSVNEGDAVAIASGAYLGANKAVVLMQNSGLTNAVSPLVSLNYPFKLPVLGFVSLRGERGIADEPQHELMGQITVPLLEQMQIKHTLLSANLNQAMDQLIEANSCIEKNQSFFFVVKKKTFTSQILNNNLPNKSKGSLFIKTKSKEDQLPTRYEALEIINNCKDKDTVQLATTGKTGRELCEIEDAVNNLYMVGSMGCVGSLGLGLALTRPDKDIVVIDGDGSILMRMGSMATNGYCGPNNLMHILLDNNSYDSTGGQRTISSMLNFVGLAACCGYSNSVYVHNLSELKIYMNQWKHQKELTFLYLKIAPGSRENLGRPEIKPFEVAERLRVFINDKNSGDFSSWKGQ